MNQFSGACQGSRPQNTTVQRKEPRRTPARKDGGWNKFLYEQRGPGPQTENTGHLWPVEDRLPLLRKAGRPVRLGGGSFCREDGPFGRQTRRDTDGTSSPSRASTSRPVLIMSPPSWGAWVCLRVGDGLGGLYIKATMLLVNETPKGSVDGLLGGLVCVDRTTPSTIRRAPRSTRGRAVSSEGWAFRRELQFQRARKSASAWGCCPWIVRFVSFPPYQSQREGYPFRREA